MKRNGERETERSWILLVEDNPHDVELTLLALEERGLGGSVRVARDGVAALEILFGSDGEPPAEPLPVLILLDLKLPRIDGLEVLRRVKSDERTRDIPVVVLSSSRQESDLEASYALGANSYIVKPVNYEQFVEAVAELGLYWTSVNDSPTAGGSGIE